MRKITIRNPDTKRIYHCWHYCRACGTAWTHSQADWEDIKKHVKVKHHMNWNLISTVPGECASVDIPIEWLRR